MIFVAILTRLASRGQSVRVVVDQDGGGGLGREPLDGVRGGGEAGRVGEDAAVLADVVTLRSTGMRVSLPSSAPNSRSVQKRPARYAGVSSAIPALAIRSPVSICRD